MPLYLLRFECSEIREKDALTVFCYQQFKVQAEAVGCLFILDDRPPVEIVHAILRSDLAVEGIAVVPCANELALRGQTQFADEQIRPHVTRFNEGEDYYNVTRPGRVRNRLLMSKQLINAPLFRRSELPLPENQHEHCDFCWARPKSLSEGYSTMDENDWVCDACYEEYLPYFHWTLVPPPPA